MQTACWQLYWPIVLRELGTRHASPPRFNPVESVTPPHGAASGRYYVFILPPQPAGGVYNRYMRHLGISLRTLLVSAVLAAALAVGALAAPMTKITIVIKNQSGKPVDRASVIVNF